MLLSIVIVEYKSMDYADKCVKALSDKLTVPFEVIISSNSEYSESEKAAFMSFPNNVKLLYNERNGGFAYAINKGLAEAKGDYLVIMNADCLVQSDLKPLITFMQQHPEIGAIAPQLRDAEGNIQDTARPYVTPWRFIKRYFNRKLKRTISVMESKMDYSKVQTVDWLIGAFIMVSRKAYELTQGLDEAFFMYAEDVDWCTRIRMKGLEVVYYPKIWIEFKGTRRARYHWKYSKIFLQSHIYYWRKHGIFTGYPDRKKIVFE